MSVMSKWRACAIADQSSSSGLLTLGFLDTTCAGQIATTQRRPRPLSNHTEQHRRKSACQGLMLCKDVRNFFARFLRSLRCFRATPFALPMPNCAQEWHAEMSVKKRVTTSCMQLAHPCQPVFRLVLLRRHQRIIYHAESRAPTTAKGHLEAVQKDAARIRNLKSKRESAWISSAGAESFFKYISSRARCRRAAANLVHSS